MKQFSLLLLLLLLSAPAFSQSTLCSPIAPAPNTPYGFDPQPAPAGQINQPYNETVQLILPASAADLGIPGGLPIDEFRLTGVIGLPTGLTWETSQGNTLPITITGTPTVQPHECITISGLPIVTTTANDSAYFQIEAIIVGFAAPVSLGLHIPINGLGGAPVVSASPSNATVCIGDSLTLTANGADTYVWYSDVALSNQIGMGATQTVSPALSQAFYVVGTDNASGLSDTGQVFVSTINCGTGIPCTPTPPTASTQWGFTPDPAPTGTVGSYYQETVDMVFPGNGADVGLTALPVNVDSIIITNIYNIPAGLSYYTNQGGALPQVYVNQVAPAKPFGCITFLGTPTAPTSPTDSVYFSLTVWAQGISIPFTVGYRIPIDASSTPPFVQIAPTSASICSGQTVTLTAGGANTYEWQIAGSTVGSGASYVFNGTTTSEVIVIGTDNSTGLSANDTVTVDVSNCDVLQFSTVATNPTCFGSADGSIEFSSTQSLTYSIDGGATTQTSGSFPTLDAGIYTILVSDGTTDSSFTLTLTEPTVITFDANGTDALCATSTNASVSFSNVSGGVPGYTYSVDGVNFTQNSTIGNLAPGIYSVTVRDASGCLASDNVTLNAPDSIALATVLTQPSGGPVNDGAIDLSVIGGAPPYDYLWNNGADTEDLNDLGFGQYSVVVEDANGCVATTTVILDGTIGIAPNNTLEALVYPNPTNGMLVVKTSLEFSRLTANVFDMTGRLVHSEELPAGVAQLDLSSQTAGIYLLELSTSDRREVQRIVIR